MPEISRLNDDSDWIDLDFVEREETPEPLMKLGIHLHAAGLSLYRTYQFTNHFRHAEPATVETWLQTTAFIENQAI